MLYLELSIPICPFLWDWETKRLHTNGQHIMWQLLAVVLEPLSLFAETLESFLEPTFCPSLLLKVGLDVFQRTEWLRSVIIAEAFCVITPGPSVGHSALCSQDLNHQGNWKCVNILLLLATCRKYLDLLMFDLGWAPEESTMLYIAFLLFSCCCSSSW